MFFCGACSVLCQSWGAIKSSPEVGKFLQTSGIVIEDPDALMWNCCAAGDDLGEGWGADV